MTTKSIDKKIQILPGPESTGKTEAAKEYCRRNRAGCTVYIRRINGNE